MPEQDGQDEMYTVVLEPENHRMRNDAEAQFARERQAFWAMHPQLLATYEGQYVAIMHGRVVDSDRDERALVQRVYKTLGYQPMYVQYVTVGPLPVYRQLSPRVVKS